ncbi:hypothetical protein ABT340_31300 [Streptosporangium sp. NPDC000239]|uniref:hypothetical protein n=1 Tax=Streptosporangium sp. NPDC000239 TaxID=3154248 RepID=UPI003325EFFD
MTGHDPENERRLIELLGTIHRGWRYEARDMPGLPRWWAYRYQPVTPAQHAAGARDVLARTTVHRLAQALGLQDGITHIIRT